MALRKKVEQALENAFHPDVLDLDDDGGISGIIVSEQFREVTPLDRQGLLDKALRGAQAKLTRAELSQILAIAPLTPTEFHALGPWKKRKSNQGEKVDNGKKDKKQNGQ